MNSYTGIFQWTILRLLSSPAKKKTDIQLNCITKLKRFEIVGNVQLLIAICVGFVLIFLKANFPCLFDKVCAFRGIHLFNVYVVFLIFHRLLFLDFLLKTMLMYICIYVLYILKTKYKRKTLLMFSYRLFPLGKKDRKLFIGNKTYYWGFIDYKIMGVQ